MTKARPDLNIPWWEQFPERLEEESQRFATALPQPFVLRCDPRNSDLTIPGAEHRFIWRGEVHARLRGALPRSAGASGTGRFLVDFIYPVNYPFERIQVEFVKPRIEGARHLAAPSCPCYLSYNPNGWTPTTTNLQVYDLIKNWLVGHLSGWTLGNSINVPEHALFLGGGLSAIQVLMPPEIYQRSNRGLGQGVLELQARTRGNGQSVTLVQMLRDHRWKSVIQCNTLESALPMLMGNGAKWEHPAIWFDVEGEVAPIRSVQDLFQLYERQGPFAGQPGARLRFERFLMAHAMREMSLIFVRFRSASDQLMWLGVALFPDKKAVALPRINRNLRPLRGRGQLRQLQLRRGTLCALSLHPLRQRDLFRRLEGVYPAQEFHAKKVAVIGCGAVGAPAAVLLAKAGIGHFTLCDGDSFSPANVVRHELDLRFVGRNKAQSMKEHLEALNPFVKVQAVPQALSTPAAIRDAMRDADVILVAIADKAIEALISRVALSENKTVFYGRGHAQMSVARVARVVPGKDACALCLDRHAQEEENERSDRYLWVEETRNWLFDDGCGSAAVPGAAVDTQQIGNLLARQAIVFLEGESEEKNHWVQVSRSQPDAQDYRLRTQGILHAQVFDPFPDCPECAFYQEEKAAHDNGINTLARLGAEVTPETPFFDRIEISPAVKRLIVDECAACGRLETGGVLAGYVDAKRSVLVVTHATDAGPNATHRPRFFQRDRAHCQREIERICEQSEGVSDYIGEWHKHVSADTRPSPTDEQTLLNIATRENYALTQSAMIICGMPQATRPQNHTLRGLTLRRGENRVQYVPVQVVPVQVVGLDAEGGN